MALPGIQSMTVDRETVHGPPTIQEFIADLHSKIGETLKKTTEDIAAWAEQMRSVRDRERQRFESQIEIVTWNLNAANEAVGILRERLQESRMECARLKEEIERLKLLLQVNKSQGNVPDGEVERLLETSQQLREWKQDAKERNLSLAKRFDDTRKKYPELIDYDRSIRSQLEAAREEIRWLRQGLDGHGKAEAKATTGLQVPIVLPTHINAIKQSLELAFREIERANSRIDSIKRPGMISLLTQGKEELDTATDSEPAQPSSRENDHQLQNGRETHGKSSSRRNDTGGLDGLWDSPGDGDSEDTLVPQLVEEQIEPLILFREEHTGTQDQGNRNPSRPPLEESFDWSQARQASTSAIDDHHLTLPQGQRTTFTAIEKGHATQTRGRGASFSLLEDDEDVPPPQGQGVSVTLVEDLDDPELPRFQRQRVVSIAASNTQGDTQSEKLSPAQSPWSPDSNMPSQSKLKPWEIFGGEKGGAKSLIDPLFEMFPRPLEDNGIPYMPSLHFSNPVDIGDKVEDTQPRAKRVSFSVMSDGDDDIQAHSPKSFSTFSGESDSTPPQTGTRLRASNSVHYDKEICGFYRNILHEIEEVIENRDLWNWWVYTFDDSLVLSTHEDEVLNEGHKCFLCRREMIGGEGVRWKRISIRDRKLRARSKFFGILYDMLLAHCEWTKADEGVDIILGHINQPYGKTRLLCPFVCLADSLVILNALCLLVGPTEIKSWVDTTYNYLPSSQPGPEKAVDATRRIFEYFQPLLSSAATRDDRAELLKRLSKLCHATHALGKKIYKSRFYELRNVAREGKEPSRRRHLGLTHDSWRGNYRMLSLLRKIGLGQILPMDCRQRY